MVVFLFAGLGLPPAQAGNGRVCRLVDASGRNVNIKLPVRRVVVLNSDALEAVRILGAQELVVGVYDRIAEAPGFWGRLARCPSVGNWREPDCEAIAALHPDLVLAYGYTPAPFLNRRLEPLGITVLRLDFFRLATLEREVSLLGEVLGKTAEANRFIQWLSRNRGVIQGVLADARVRPRVYMEGYGSMKAVGPGSSGYAMCVAAGGDPISSDLSIPHPLISTEWLLRENPRVIVKVSNLMDSYDNPNDDGLRRIWRELVNRKGWRNLDAVRERRVHVLAQDLWVGPGMLVGLAHLVKWFYPEAGRDLRPVRLHQEYLERFQDLPLRGCFTYSGGE